MSRMGKRLPFVLAVVLVLLLVGGSIAVYAYDHGREDTIAKGVTVAGIDVGGMKRDAAKRLLQERLASRVNRPIVVRANHRRFRMSAARAQVTTDVGGMVAEAIQDSRRGSIVSRTWRGLTGGKVHKTVALRLNYSKDAVAALVARVKHAVNRSPKSASITPSPSGLTRVSSRTGIALQAADLQSRVDSAI